MASLKASDDFTDRRIMAGAKIFRALLAADVDIARKTEKDGRLKLYLVYIHDTQNAEKTLKTLLGRNDTRIRKMEVIAEPISFSAFIETSPAPSGGIFLTEPIKGVHLHNLMERANGQNTVVFSPFEGDVERGVHGGITVEARVRPFINLEAIQSAGIQLKPFFIKVAKQHDTAK